MIWILLCCILGSQADISIVGVQKYVKEAVKFNKDKYTYGIWDITFDQELSLYQPFGSAACLTNPTCHPGNLTCPPCNWTDPLVCDGTIRGPNSTCPCGKPPVLCNPARYQFPMFRWPFNSSVAIIEAATIADIMHHPSPPDNCSCIVYTYDTLVGATGGNLLYYGELWVGSDGVRLVSSWGTLTICPSDPRWGQTNIFRAIALGVPGSTYVKLQLTVDYRPVPTAIYTNSCSVDPALATTHQCLPTNVYTTLSPLNASTYIRVSIDPPADQRCGVVSFWASSFEHLLSTDPWVSPTNSSGAFRTHRHSYPDNRVWPSVYPYCLQPGQRLYAMILSSRPVDFYIDTAGDWMKLRSFSDIGPMSFYKNTLGTVTLVCPSKNFTAHRVTYTTSENMNTGSANIRVGYPSDDVDVFYPPPFFASPSYYAVGALPLKPLIPRRLIVSVLLEQDLDPRAQPLTWTGSWVQNKHRWLTQEEWNACYLQINGGFVAADGSNVMLTTRQLTTTKRQLAANTQTKRQQAALTVNQGLPPCDPVLYTAASQRIDQIKEELLQPNLRSVDINRLQFYQDRIADSNAFYVCKRQVTNYYSTKPANILTAVVNKCTAAFGTPEFDNDPCCVLNDTLLYTGCVAESRNITQTSILGYNTNQCVVEECARVSLTNLVDKLNLEADPEACTNTVERVVNDNIYWRCIEDSWGPEVLSFPGQQCVHDIDCPNSTCSMYSKRCITNVTEEEIAVISCVYDNLNQFSRTYISNELGVDPTAANIKDLWLAGFSTPLACSDPHVPIGSDVNLVVRATCAGCNSFAPNTTRFLPSFVISPGPSWPQFGFGCWAPGSLACTATQTFFPAVAACRIMGCNIIPYSIKDYFPYIALPAECPIGRNFCGVTDDGFFYVDVTPTVPLANCGSTVCFLANGSRVTVTSAVECLSLYSCDASPNATSSDECTVSGTCSDSTDYDLSIWSGLYATETAGCFFSLRYKTPFNPTAVVCEPPFRNTILGCSVYPGPSGMPGYLFPINQSSCESGTFAWGDPASLELTNPRWLTPATTSAECAAYGTICDDDSIVFPAGLPTYTNTFSFTPNCPSARPLYSWTPGRWLPGQPRVTVNTTVALARRFTGPPRIGLNLPKVLGNLTKAIETLTALKQQSDTFCRGAYKKSVDEIVCSCMLRNNDSSCYSDKINISTIGVACDEVGTILSQDLLLNLSATSLPVATCDNLYISADSIVNYRTRDITPLRTLLLNYAEDSEWAIRNSQLGIYGKVLTNGYSMKFGVPIVNVTLCILVPDIRQHYNNARYPILDVAQRLVGSSIDDLIPMNLQVSMVDGYLCANLSQLQTDKIYYVIQMVNTNYTTVKRSVFASGEVVMIGVVLALFTIGMLISLTKFCLHMVSCFHVSRGDNRGRKTIYTYAVVLGLIVTYFIFRVTLFSLVLNGGLLGARSSRAVGYLLFEFPGLLFFTFVTNYVLELTRTTSI
jgi:hypothetical protein